MAYDSYSDEEKVWRMLEALLRTGEIKAYMLRGAISTDDDGRTGKVNVLIDMETYLELIEKHDAFYKNFVA